MFIKKSGACLLLLAAVFLLICDRQVMGEFFEIPARAYLVMNLDSGEVLESENLDEPMPMASTTKIMTCILALEHLNLDEEITVQDDWVKIEGSTLGLRGGYTLTVYDLLVGMMLRSGNDAANTVAYLVSGSVPDFVKLMNQKAADLAMLHTSFASPSGLPNAYHYSTVRDMATLAKYALDNDTFVNICSMDSATISVSGENWSVHNTNKLLGTYDGAIGIKTGFTNLAGKCLISAVYRPQGKYLCVTFNCADHFTYHAQVYNTIFENLVQFNSSLPHLGQSVPVIGGQSDKVWVNSVDLGFIFTKQPTLVGVYLPSFLYAPIKEGDVIGFEEYRVQGTVQTVKRQIVATEDIQAIPAKLPWYKKIFGFFFS